MADMSIALGARPVQIEGPMNHLANAMKLRELQNQNALHELSLQEARAAATERNALRGLNPTDADYQDQLMRVSPTQGIAYMKEKHLAEAAADTAAKAKSELVDARLKRSREYLSNVSTPEDYMAWHQANHADPILGPELKARGVTAESARASIERALAAPGGLQKLIDQSKLGVEKFMEMNKPTFKDFNVPGVGVQTGVVRGGEFAPGQLYASSDVISPEAEAQKARIAKAGRNPVQPNPVQSQFFKGADGNVYEVVKGTRQATPVLKADGSQLAAAEYDPGLAAGVAAGKEGGKASSEMAVKDYGTAQASVKAIPKVDALIAQLQKGDVTTGSAAEILLGVNKAIAQLGGKDAAKRATESEIADVMMGSEVFPLIQSLGIGARGMDTPAEKDFLRSVLTGSLKLEKGTLLQMAKMRKEALQGGIDSWNSSVDSGSRDRFFTATKIPKARLGVPSAAAAPSAASQIPTNQAPNAAPATARTVTRTGTSNGRKVVQYSDGSIEYAD